LTLKLKVLADPHIATSPPAPTKLRMPRSIVGGDLAVPDMAQPYMKKDDDDEDG
jgi:hypothetical protein